MNTDQIIVILTIVFIIIALYKELMRPPVTFLVAIVGLNIFGILSPKDILAGFSNEQISIVDFSLLNTISEEKLSVNLEYYLSTSYTT